MKQGIEWQVCSLENAKKLKALGVPQISLWYHFENRVFTSGEMRGKTIHDGNRPVSAYTVSELGELLPATIRQPHWSEEVRREREEFLKDGMFESIEDTYETLWYESGKDSNRNYQSNYGTDGVSYIDFTEATEADARALLLIHLIEQGLVDVKLLGNKE